MHQIELTAINREHIIHFLTFVAGGLNVLELGAGIQKKRSYVLALWILQNINLFTRFCKLSSQTR